MAGKIKVGVLFGGQSSEHEVSLASARSVMFALNPEKYDIVPIGITKRGAWLIGGDPMLQLRSGSEAVDNGAGVGSTLPLDIVGEGRSGKPLDVVFPVLHGPYGEDGTVQGLLELAGVPYVGAGVLGSAVGMDKAVMKQVFIAQGLPIVPFVHVTRREWQRDPDAVRRNAEAQLPYPMFAKPANMGSSVGVGKIHGAEDFAAALDNAAKYDRRIIIEQGVDARECECAVLGNDDPQASVVGEIVPGNEFYDYRAKYVDSNSALFIPADLPRGISEEIRRISVEAFRAVDASGMSRVDFFVARDLSAVWLNEINTIPGFTRISMYPQLWEASGLSYPALLDRLIELAIERHGDRMQSKAALADVAAELDV